MDNKTIRGIKVAPGQKPEIIEIGNNLLDLKKLVSEGADELGSIETLTVNNDVVFLLNEEGKCIGLPCNREFMGDILTGTFGIFGIDGSEFCDLSEDNITYYCNLFRNPESFAEDTGFKMQWFMGMM